MSDHEESTAQTAPLATHESAPSTPGVAEAPPAPKTLTAEAWGQAKSIGRAVLDLAIEANAWVLTEADHHVHHLITEADFDDGIADAREAIRTANPRKIAAQWAVEKKIPAWHLAAASMVAKVQGNPWVTTEVDHDQAKYPSGLREDHHPITEADFDAAVEAAK
jgi:hypothetical protein